MNLFAGRTPQCTQPTEGWYCSREAGHSGPCAAVPNCKGVVTTGLDLETVAALWQAHYMQPQAFARAVLEAARAKQ